jgi:hemerythrin-like metal-binding protein
MKRLTIQGKLLGPLVLLGIVVVAGQLYFALTAVETARQTEMIIGVLIIGVLFMIVLGYYQLSFIGPLERIRQQIDKMSRGNLDAENGAGSTGDSGAIARMIDGLGDVLRRIVGETVGTTDAIGTLMENLDKTTRKMSQSTSTAKQKVNTIAETSKDISGNMNTVAAAAEQASVNVSTISQTIDNFSMNMNTVAAAAEEASTNMNDISINVSNISKEINRITASIESMSESLNNINKNTTNVIQYSAETASGVDETLESMNELAVTTQEISKILKLVNDIASQTNMLALNATIEAASAGEAGKGFAVVAGEIKELAKQTTDANAEIAQQIKQVQENVSRSQNHVQKISRVFTQVSELNQGIATLVEEQTQNSVQLVEAIDAVASAAKNSALNIEEAASGIKEITRSTAEAFKGSQETARNVGETSVGVKEIAQSSARTAKIIVDINNDIQSINIAINEVSQSIDQNLESVANFANITTALEKSARFFTANSNILFFWTDQLRVDHPIIDRQHQQIVDSINDIYLSIRQKADKPTLLEQLKHLQVLASDHFEEEQKHFIDTAYTGATEHVEKHQHILEQLSSFIEQYQSGQQNIDEEVPTFFKNWLIKHIMTLDKSYQPFLGPGAG